MTIKTTRPLSKSFGLWGRGMGPRLLKGSSFKHVVGREAATDLDSEEPRSFVEIGRAYE